MEIKLLASLLIKLIIEYVTGRQVGFLSLVSRIRQLYTQSQAAMSSRDSSPQGISPPNLGHEGGRVYCALSTSNLLSRERREEGGRLGIPSYTFQSQKPEEITLPTSQQNE